MVGASSGFYRETGGMMNPDLGQNIKAESLVKAHLPSSSYSRDIIGSPSARVGEGLKGAIPAFPLWLNGNEPDWYP